MYNKIVILVNTCIIIVYIGYLNGLFIINVYVPNRPRSKCMILNSSTLTLAILS